MGSTGQGTTEGRPAHVTVLELEGQPHVVPFRGGRQRDGHRVRPTDPVHHDGLQPAAIATLLLAKEASGRSGGAERDAERAQQRHHDVGSGLLAPPVHVVVCGLDTVEAGERGQVGVEPAHRSDPRMWRMPRAGMSTHVGRLFTS